MTLYEKNLLREEISQAFEKNILDVGADLIVHGQNRLARELLSDRQNSALHDRLKKQVRILTKHIKAEKHDGRKANINSISKKHSHSSHGSYGCKQCREMRMQSFRDRIVSLYYNFADALLMLKGDSLMIKRHCKFVTLTIGHKIGEGTGLRIAKYYEGLRQFIQKRVKRRDEVVSLSFVVGQNTEDGATHYHILLISTFEIEQKWLVDYWHKKVDSIIDVKDITDGFADISRIATYMAANLNYANGEIKRRFSVGERAIKSLNDLITLREIGELPAPGRKCDNCYQKDWCMLKSQSAIRDCEGPFISYPRKDSSKSKWLTK